MALTDKLTAIGDAIREKTGKSALLSLDEMPVEIRAIEGGEIIEIESHEWEDTYLQGSITGFDKISYENDRITKIASYRLQGSPFISIILPNVEEVGNYGLCASSYAKTVSLPKCKKVGDNGLAQLKYQNYDFSALETIGNYGFFSNNYTGTLSLPNLKTGGNNLFQECSMSQYDLPLLETIGSNGFQNQRNLEEIKLPSLTKIPRQLFSYSSKFKKADFGVNCKEIETGINYDFYSPFASCNLFETLILRSDTLIPNPTSYFISTSNKIYKGTGYIYVPAALVEEYKVAANWSVYADQFRAIEDYSDICGEA